jgi:hypothetical protein
MITQVQAAYLLALPKEFNPKVPTVNLADEKIKWNLVSPDDSEWEFLVEINNSRKKSFRISLHHQENITKTGLLRIDFNSGHRNPELINSFVPEILHKYAGHWFLNEPHIHLFVEGYKDLAWALPLAEYDNFPIKDIQSDQEYSQAIKAFAKHINLNSNFVIQQTLI